MLQSQRATLILIASAILDTIKEADPVIGAPAGPLYAAMANYGMSLQVFEQIMSALVKSGKLRKSGHCYFPVP